MYRGLLESILFHSRSVIRAADIADVGIANYFFVFLFLLTMRIA